MIGRADIEGSKSNVAMNAWLPQASYPCGTVVPSRDVRGLILIVTPGLYFDRQDLPRLRGDLLPFVLGPSLKGARLYLKPYLKVEPIAI
jgi:hypothetical protein